MFGSRKESQTALSHRKAFALNAVFASIEAIVGGRIDPKDYAILQSPFGNLQARDGGQVYFTRIAGHFIRRKNGESSSFSAEFYCRHYDDKGPAIEYDCIQIIVIDDYWKYQVEWQTPQTFQYRQSTNESVFEGWRQVQIPVE